MGQVAMGITHQKVTEPEPRGERVAKYVERYLEVHPGLSLGELAFRLKADKRDLQRLTRERSCGWRLEDALAAYFGEDFVDALFRPVVGWGPSQREKELERERAEMAARRKRLEQERADRRTEAEAVRRLGADQGGRTGL